MKRVYLPLFAALILAAGPAQADVRFSTAHGTESYYTPCFPVYSTASDGATTLSGVTGSTSSFIIYAQIDNTAVDIEYETTADIETIATIGTYAAPTADTDIRFGECGTPGTYQLQPRDTLLATAGAKAITFKLSDGGSTMADQIVHLDLNVLDAAALVDAFFEEACGGHTTSGTAGQRICETIPAINSTVNGTGVNIAEGGISNQSFEEGTLPDNFADLAITVTDGKVTVGTNDDKTGYDLNADQSGVTIGTLGGHTPQTGDAYARLGAPAGASVSADIAAAQSDLNTLTAGVNVTQINGSSPAATQLALSAATIESGVAEGTPTTTVIQTDLAETQDDIYIGRVVIFTSGDARGEATTITDYAGSTGTLTVTELANAPAAGDTFVIL